MSMLNMTFALTVRALRVDSRNLSPHLMRAGLGFFVFIFLMSVHAELMYQAPGRTLFGWIIYANTVFASFVVPMLFATAITEEKEERTLALLQIADVSPFTLLIGKSLPRMLSLFQIFIIQLPFCMLAITLGGVSLEQVLSCYVAVGAYSFFIACVGLWCSVIFRTSASAMGLAGILVLGYHVLPLMLFGIFSMLSLYPFWAPISLTVIQGLGYFWPTSISTQLPIILSPGYSGGIPEKQIAVNVITGLVFFLLSQRTFQFFNREVDSAPVRRRSQKTSEKSSRRRRAWSSAILWKEFYFGAGGHLYLIGKLMFYGLTVLLISLAIAGWQWSKMNLEYTAVISTNVMFFLFFPLELVLTIARVFYPEVRDKTLSSLVMLPISIRQLAYSKIIGGLLGLIPVLTYLSLGLLIHPDPLQSIWKEFQSSPLEMSLVVLNILGQILLYLHGVVWLSVRMNGLWAIFVAGIIQYFVMLFVGLFFMLMIAYSGVSIPDQAGQFIAFLAAAAVFAFTLFLHINTGFQLKQKAAQA